MNHREHDLGLSVSGSPNVSRETGAGLSPYYEDDSVLIYHGDCREILPQIRYHVDLVLTDPPYGVGIEYGDNSRDGFDDWCSLIDTVLPMCRQLAKCTMLCTSKIEGEKHIWKCHEPDYRLCWYKGAMPTRSFVGFKDWETVFVWGRSWSNPIHDHFQASCEDFGYLGHPCPKSEQWATHLLSRCLSGRVLDPFMGSGTTLRCAKNLNQKAIGIDIEEKYCEIAARRMSQEVFSLGVASNPQDQVLDTAPLFT